MTREEIIKGLEGYIPWADEYEVDIEVLTGALELLKKEPCGDAISRQAVLDRKYVVEVKNMWHMTEEIEVVNVNDIKALPPVNPQEPKTGHRLYNDIYDHYLCGNCKTIVMDYDNFCPHCGCRMIKPQESEE